MSTPAIPASTRAILTLLVFWSGFGFARPVLLPHTATFAIGAMLAGLAWLSWPRRPVIPGGLVLFVALVCASAAWSASPGEVVIYAAAIVTIALAGVLIASWLDGSAILKTLHLSLVASIVASVIVATIDPTVGLDQGVQAFGSLQGIFPQKNVLGTQIVIGVATCLFAPRTGRFQRVRTIVGLAVYAYAIYTSESMTALLLSVMAIAIWLVVHSWGRITTGARAVRLSVYTIVFTAIGVAVVANLSALFLMLGKDPTLTNRTPRWTASLQIWRDHPILGYGWGSSFNRGDEAFEKLRVLMGFYALGGPNNGFLFAAVSGGIVAVLSLTYFLFRTLVSVCREVILWPDKVSMWAVVITFVFIVNNAVDSRLDGTALVVVIIAAAVVKRRQTSSRDASEGPQMHDSERPQTRSLGGYSGSRFLTPTP